jgi:hypothetical protein
MTTVCCVRPVRFCIDALALSRKSGTQSALMTQIALSSDVGALVAMFDLGARFTKHCNGPGLLREALSRLYRTGRATLQSTRNADVAQLVEQPIRNRQVTGSSPVVGSTYGIQVRWNLLRFLSGFVPLFLFYFSFAACTPSSCSA